MSVLFICDNCEDQYPARLTLKGGIIVDGQQIKRETDPCPKCLAEAEEATKQALEKRRKKE